MFNRIVDSDRLGSIICSISQNFRKRLETKIPSRILLAKVKCSPRSKNIIFPSLDKGKNFLWAGVQFSGVTRRVKMQTVLTEIKAASA